MLTVVVACLAMQQIFKYKGIFAEQLRLKGHDVVDDPGRGFLNRVGVPSVMNASFSLSQQHISMNQAAELLGSKHLWLVVNGEDGRHLMATADLAAFIDSEDSRPRQQRQKPDRQIRAATSAPEIDLLAIAEKRFKLCQVDALADLREASRLINSPGAEALLVVESIDSPQPKVVGIISKETITEFYH